MDYLLNYGLLILGILITLGAQAFIKLTYNKYKKVRNVSNIKGYEMARYILDKHNMSNVKVVKVSGELTDHYDPTSKVVRLSESIYDSNTIAAIAVAAHECGHAIQDKEGYLMMRIRSLLVPVVNLSSYAGYLAITIGALASLTKLIWIGIYCELAIVLFHLVTLPVEIDASRRGLKELKNNDRVDSSEYSGSLVMLIAAASTYLAAVITALLEALRLILMFTGKDRD